MPAEAEDCAGAGRPSANQLLEVNEAPDGLVIYDSQTNNVHYLNPTAGAVFVLCTGDNDVSAIAAQLQEVFGLADPPTAQVTECVHELLAQGLVR